MSETRLTLTALARAGFSELHEAREEIAEAAEIAGLDQEDLRQACRACADPDGAVHGLLELLRKAPRSMLPMLSLSADLDRLLRVLGASRGLAEFFLRYPDELAVLLEPGNALPSGPTMRAALLDSVGAVDGVAAVSGEGAWTALRIRYRRQLARVAAIDLEQEDALEGIDGIMVALADLAAAALEASLAVARAEVAGEGPGTFPAEEVAATRLAIIGMGKAGAAELNYVSDVDVIFVAEPEPGSGLSGARAVDIGTRLAMLTIRGIENPALEPALWEVDSNLRPEGRDGALVRSLESHLGYYERWAKSWEFQALLKASPLAGDLGLGREYVEGVAPLVWASSARDNFVESVQRMRERVTENIPQEEVGRQLKLGPGGLRDVEFTVQLLQLVHGSEDPDVRQPGTLPALAALGARGYIGRTEAAEFARDYRELRLMEHRLQLHGLRRTHLMPGDDAELRILARSTGLATDGAKLKARWFAVKRRVRGLHERLFYRPLLAAVASLPAEDRVLTSAQAGARLAATGFRDPQGALAQIAALTSGVSRRAAIHRHLLPVLLQWFGDGPDPDYGLRTFRRLSEDLGNSPWYLRMLRDSATAAERLTAVLSGSRFVGELLGVSPAAVAWLEHDADLRPRDRARLDEEQRAVLARHAEPEAAAAALRGARRREVLRLALSGVLGLCTVTELATALSDVTEVYLAGILRAARAASPGGVEFAVIGMGRLGGREIGFGSDADILYVYRADGVGGEEATAAAEKIVAGVRTLSQDPRLPFELDISLRPEGKSGRPVRSLEAYRAYYERWSWTWEAQALLRARGVAGDAGLIDDFERLADRVRYPSAISEAQVREVKRIKARVEGERLPRGADPTRHLKLGRGSLSDVEWFVQLEQLQHAAAVPELRTTSTLEALRVCVERGFVEEADAELLRESWLFVSRVRSAATLWSNKGSDVLPAYREQLEGIARLLEYPAGSATELEEDYLGVTRRARAVFERGFYGVEERPTPSTA